MTVTFFSEWLCAWTYVFCQCICTRCLVLVVPNLPRN